jgi:predicted secreted protein
MNNLLNEEEFFPKEYNPNRWFRIFYAGALIYEAISITAFRFIHIESRAVSIALGIVLGLVLPMSAAMTMVFSKKEILLDTSKSKIILGIFLVLACFFAPRIAIAAYDFVNIYLQESNIIEAIILMPIAIWLILFIICIAVVLPLVNRARKIKKRSLTNI